MNFVSISKPDAEAVLECTWVANFGIFSSLRIPCQTEPIELKMVKGSAFEE